MKKTNFIIILNILFSCNIFVQNIHAQNEIKCGTDKAMVTFYKNNPDEQKEKIEFEKFTRKFVKQRKKEERKSSDSYVIPVVFHVFGTKYNKESTVNLAVVKEALRLTNEDFQGLRADWADVDPDFASIKKEMNVTFKLAQLDPDGNPTSGVIIYPKDAGFGNGDSEAVSKIKKVAWDNYKYMNVYITRDLYDNGDFYESGIAWYPSASMSDNSTARVVYNGSFLGTNTDDNFRSVLTHEFGHWLNLAHTFDGGCTYPNDHVDDTPPADNTHMGLCDKNILNCEGNKTNGDNFMDYTKCYNMYTQGQVVRMEAAMQHLARFPLWQLENLNTTGVSGNLGARLIPTSVNLSESFLNTGIIANSTEIIGVDGAKFALSSGVLTDNHYTVTGVPSGLNLSIEVKNDSTVQVHLTGNANNHLEANSVDNLKIEFKDAAIQGDVSSLFKSFVLLKVMFLDPYTEYCKTGTNYNLYSYIQNVTLGSISNTSEGDYYKSYLNDYIVKGYPEDLINVSVTILNTRKPTDENYIVFWADWNDDFIFEPSEQIEVHSFGNDYETDHTYTYTTTIKIPTGTLPGHIGLRIVSHDGDEEDHADPCGIVGAGEIEDYGIIIMDPLGTLSADFSSTKTDVNFSDKVSFIDLSTVPQAEPISSWQWSFPGGVPASSNSETPPSITYPNAGTYNVSLSITDVNNVKKDITKSNYITSSLNYCDCAVDWDGYGNVHKFELGTITNTTSLDRSLRYADYFNTHQTVLKTGETYPITITTHKGVYRDNSGTFRVKVWADWNYNSYFDETEVWAEYTYDVNKSGADGLYVYSKDLIVPLNAKVETLGLRVLIEFVGEGESVPCQHLKDGEVEDYGLIITEGSRVLIADFISEKVPQPYAETAIFTDKSSVAPSTSIKLWDWAFSGGTPSIYSGQNPPEISFDKLGSHDITLKVTSNDGNEHVVTKKINVEYIPCKPTIEWDNYGSITKVAIGSIQNETDQGLYVNYYDTHQTTVVRGDYHPLTISLHQGTAGNINIKGNFRVRAWADWDFDGVFDNDELAINHIVPANDFVSKQVTVLDSILVPADAKLGAKTGLRIMLHYVHDANEGSTPCYDLEDGEVEDYAIVITDELYSSEIINEAEILLFPNPADEYINIAFDSLVDITDISIRIINPIGKYESVLSEKTKARVRVDISSLIEGIYFVEIVCGDIKVVKSLSIVR